MRKLCFVISGVHLVPPFVRGTSDGRQVQEEKPLTSRTLRYALKGSGKWEPRLVVSLKSVPILIVLSKESSKGTLSSQGHCLNYVCVYVCVHVCGVCFERVAP